MKILNNSRIVMLQEVYFQIPFHFVPVNAGRALNILPFFPYLSSCLRTINFKNSPSSAV